MRFDRSRARIKEEMSRTALLAFLFVLVVWAENLSLASADPAQQQRIRRLEESMLAPCCWAEPVSVHRSEVALQMRMEIERFVAQGKSDREIYDHYTSIHGTRILVEPEGALRFWVYTIPVVGTLAGLGLLILFIKRLLNPVSLDQSAQG